MTAFVISMILAVAVLVGSLIALLRGYRDPMGSPEALERAKRRNLEIEALEKREEER
jgi:hypothetical protein